MIKKFYELQETWRTDVHTVRTDGRTARWTDGPLVTKAIYNFFPSKSGYKKFGNSEGGRAWIPDPHPWIRFFVTHSPCILSSVAAYTTLIMYPGYICVQYTIFGCILNAFDIEIQNHFGRYSSHNQTVTIARHTNNHRASYHRIL